MSKRWISAFAITAGLMIVGCDQSSSTPATMPSAAADSAKDSTKDAMGSAKDAAGSAGTAMKDAATSTKDKMAGMAADAKTKMSDATSTTQPAVPPAAADAASSQAQTLIDQAMGYIKDNKLDMAETTVTKLEGMKASLPASMQSAVDGARKALTAAKATSGGGVGGLLPK